MECALNAIPDTQFPTVNASTATPLSPTAKTAPKTIALKLPVLSAQATSTLQPPQLQNVSHVPLWTAVKVMDVTVKRASVQVVDTAGVQISKILAVFFFLMKLKIVPL